MTTIRLEQIRAAIRAENVSYGELAELQDLADQINPGDVELLQWAGVPEFSEDDESDETLNERVYDALIAAGRKALADEFADAMIKGGI
jgi:hypothetical protein